MKDQINHANQMSKNDLPDLLKSYNSFRNRDKTDQKKHWKKVAMKKRGEENADKEEEYADSFTKEEEAPVNILHKF
jgi:hypothetical protein